MGKSKIITPEFLQSYLGGRFSSVQKFNVGRPSVFTGIIKKISIENGIVTFTRFVDDHEIKVILSSCWVYRYHKDFRIMFESKDTLHNVILYRPKLEE